jgi:exopolyphosphatase/pppGpp-phosphohydrolase
LQNEYDQKMKSNQDELDSARKEWRDALDEAKKKRQAKESTDAGPGKLEGPEDLLSKVRGSLSGLGDMLQTAKERTVGVTGTFNAEALLGLQAGNADDRIASATERTAKGVESLRQDVKNNQAAFV